MEAAAHRDVEETRRPTILETFDLTRHFGGLAALRGVSLTVREGEIFGLLGPNGAGKTVLQSCISGAIKPSSGRVVFAGDDVTGWPAERLCKHGIARTFQIPQPFVGMTALDNVRVAAQFGSERCSSSEATAWAHACLERVGFDRRPGTQMKALNTVDLKRVDLARALASRPRLLFLDELAAGLMTGQLASLVAVIREISGSGVTILMVEHILPAIYELCERIAVLQQGLKIAEGLLKDVASDPVVIEAYLGERAVA